MAHSFNVRVTGDPKALLRKAEAAARGSGADFTGDENAGNFSGSGVVGRYNRSGDTITIVIEKKPFYAPLPMVESKVRAFFAG